MHVKFTEWRVLDSWKSFVHEWFVGLCLDSIEENMTLHDPIKKMTNQA